MDIDISEEAGVRYLHFGSDWVQGAMRIARPYALELEYTREMMAGLILRDGATADSHWPRRVLLIGLGAGSLTKFLYRYRPNTKITVVEIEPSVVAAARFHFKLPDEDKRFHVEIADGADFIQKTKSEYDLILVDGFDEDARAGVLDTLPFYLNCKAKLSQQGLVVCNLLTRSKDYQASVDRLAEAFDGRAMAFPSCDSGNAIGVAAVGDAIHLSMDELKANADLLKDDTGLKLQPTIARLREFAGCSGGYLDI